MGFFKNIGKSLKKTISLKNLVRVGTGQFGALSGDVLKTVSGGFKKKDVQQTLGNLNTGIVGTSTKFGESIQDGVGDVISNDRGFQTNANSATRFVAQTYLKTMWQKHKKTILIVGGAVTAFLIYKFFIAKKTAVRRR
jgi:hypothetical protein